MMTPIRAIRLRHLTIVSWLIIASGVAALVAGLAMADGELWQLVGMMLLLAGGVKVVVLQLWHRVAGLETDRHNPIPPV